MIKRITIKSYEKGLYYQRGELKAIMDQGRHWFLNPFFKQNVDIVSQRKPWLIRDDLDVVIKSGLLGEDASIIDLKDNERALIWIDGRFDTILAPGQYVYWNNFKDVKVEIVDTDKIRFEHKQINTIMKKTQAAGFFEAYSIEDGFVGLYYLDGKFVEQLAPGRYYFWKNTRKVKIYQEEIRERTMDIAGQDIMTADKVTLRLNVVVNYQVKDVKKAVSSVDDMYQYIYRESQLAVRAIIGTRELDVLLTDKDDVALELEKTIRSKAEAVGVNVLSIGIRDIILPGDMKVLLNKVTEAKKAAEANLISRREEVAAMRSQANTAKLLENNPMLMRLKELEILEKLTSNSKLNVILGEKGLTDRVVNLL